MASALQIQQFRQKARAKGFTEAQIAAEIARKMKEDAVLSTKPNTPTPIAPQSGMTSQPAYDYSEAKSTPVVQPKFSSPAMNTLDKVTDFLLPRTKAYLEGEKQRLQGNADEFKKTGDYGTYLKKHVKEMIPNKEEIGVAGELASWIIPAGKAAKGATVVQKAVTAAKTGAVVAGINASTDPEDMKLEERVVKTLKAAGTGALFSGAFTGAYEIPKSIIKKQIAKAPEIIRGVLRIAPSKMKEFRHVNGMDVGEEILARDGKTIAGMDHMQMAEHFGQRKQAAIEDVAAQLADAKDTISRNDIIKKLQKLAISLAPKEGNVGTAGAASGLQAVIDDLKQNPEKPTLAVWNKIKTQLQGMGDAAFSPSGKASPESKVLAEASRVVKEAIEVKAPQVKEANKLIQLYSLVKESVETAGDANANKVASGNLQKFVQNIPTVAGAAVGFATGGPAGSVAGILGGSVISGLQGSLRNKMLSPEFQTRLANLTQKALEGIKNPTAQQIAKVSDRIAAEMSKQLARVGTAGAAAEEPVVEPGETINGEVTTDQQPDDEPQSDEQVVQDEEMIARPEDETQITGNLFGGMTKQQVLEKAFLAGANSKQLDEIETIYDRMAPQEDQKELSDQFLETGEPKTKADKVWALENPDKIPGKGSGAAGGAGGTEKERMFNNAGFAAQQALDLLESGKVDTGIGKNITGAIGEKTGKNSDDQQMYRSSLALARTAAKNALLGANMSTKEMESVAAFIPEFDDAPNIAKSKLKTFVGLMKQFSGAGAD